VASRSSTALLLLHYFFTTVPVDAASRFCAWRGARLLLYYFFTTDMLLVYNCFTHSLYYCSACRCCVSLLRVARCSSTALLLLYYCFTTILILFYYCVSAVPAGGVSRSCSSTAVLLLYYWFTTVPADAESRFCKWRGARCPLLCVTPSPTRLLGLV
jgi:hypothetical protein